MAAKQRAAFAFWQEKEQKGTVSVAAAASGKGGVDGVAGGRRTTRKLSEATSSEDPADAVLTGTVAGSGSGAGAAAGRRAGTTPSPALASGRADSPTSSSPPFSPLLASPAVASLPGKHGGKASPNPQQQQAASPALPNSGAAGPTVLPHPGVHARNVSGASNRSDGSHPSAAKHQQQDRSDGIFPNLGRQRKSSAASDYGRASASTSGPATSVAAALAGASSPETTRPPLVGSSGSGGGQRSHTSTNATITEGSDADAATSFSPASASPWTSLPRLTRKASSSANTTSSSSSSGRIWGAAAVGAAVAAPTASSHDDASVQAEMEAINAVDRDAEHGSSGYVPDGKGSGGDERRSSRQSARSGSSGTAARNLSCVQRKDSKSDLAAKSASSHSHSSSPLPSPSRGVSPGVSAPVALPRSSRHRILTTAVHAQAEVEEALSPVSLDAYGRRSSLKSHLSTASSTGSSRPSSSTRHLHGIPASLHEKMSDQDEHNSVGDGEDEEHGQGEGEQEDEKGEEEHHALLYKSMPSTSIQPNQQQLSGAPPSSAAVSCFRLGDRLLPQAQANTSALITTATATSPTLPQRQGSLTSLEHRMPQLGLPIGHGDGLQARHSSATSIESETLNGLGVTLNASEHEGPGGLQGGTGSKASDIVTVGDEADTSASASSRVPGERAADDRIGEDAAERTRRRRKLFVEEVRRRSAKLRAEQTGNFSFVSDMSAKASLLMDRRSSSQSGSGADASGGRNSGGNWVTSLEGSSNWMESDSDHMAHSDDSQDNRTNGNAAAAATAAALALRPRIIPQHLRPAKQPRSVARACPNKKEASEGSAAAASHQSVQDSSAEAESSVDEDQFVDALDSSRPESRLGSGEAAPSQEGNTRRAESESESEKSDGSVSKPSSPLLPHSATVLSISPDGLLGSSGGALLIRTRSRIRSALPPAAPTPTRPLPELPQPGTPRAPNFAQVPPAALTRSVSEETPHNAASRGAGLTEGEEGGSAAGGRRGADGEGTRVQETENEDGSQTAKPERAFKTATSSLLWGSGTIRGRRRGATIGAVPAASAPNRQAARARPRPLLSQQLALPGSVSDGEDASGRASRSLAPSGSTSASRSVSGNSSAATTLPNEYEDGVEEIPSRSGSTDRRQSFAPSDRSHSASNASLLQQVSHPQSHASFVIAVVGHHFAGKSTVIKKGLRQFGLSKPNVLSDKVTSHSTVCVVDQEQRTIEVLEIDASALLIGPNKQFAWPKSLPPIDAVILCYDASHLPSFRGMSDLLENFHAHQLSTVMLACKSEIHPKAIDPFHASEMAAVCNVGLAECTSQSEEGKKRMRDCFSYLVKEVAKSRTGRNRRNLNISTSRSASMATPTSPVVTTAEESMQQALPAPIHLTRGRNDSIASSQAGSSSSATEPSSFNGSIRPSTGGGDTSSSPTIASPQLFAADGVSVATETETLISQPRSGAGQQGSGYVDIEELWDKFFFAAVSGNDPAFLLTFMVFYRGFAKPIDLLVQLASRFESLAESADEVDILLIRFSLMRLASMLGDWVQDYPGDLSAPETYPLMVNFYRRLLQHPHTVHTAAPLQPFIEAAKFAPDLDLNWSKRTAAEAEPTHSAPGTPACRPLLLDSHTSDVHSLASSTLATISPLVSVPSLTPAATGLHDELEPHESAFSAPDSDDASNGRLKLTHPGQGRHRSASDLTLSSTEGSNPSARGTATSAAASTFNIPAVIPPAPVGSLKQLDLQKNALRSVSNALGLVDDMLIAAELTRLEWNLFSNIGPRDLLRHILIPREQREPNGPVAKSIAHFNYVSSWVGSMILVQIKAKQRARMLEKFMSIASILRRDNNYNTLQSVLAGLGNTSVHRLNQTRELINTKPVMKTYQSLTRLMKSDRSFAAYRLALENSTGRTIPFLGVHLQDILSLSDGNPSKRESDGAVHWRKFSLMDEAVMAIVKCQQYGRSASPNSGIEQLIMDVPVMDEDTLWERSLAVEPRHATTGPRNIIRKMQGTV
ncbi:hypothetical protein K437DRAFT_194683 [Tilletiaria anomala UBC 951]|uniref:Ras GEF n=1 Tax=Tilletiaria anomala (strain ATCC 24038 / CBS 436.72 / UBC 951) TaxID=1037660 RepID=A0A066VDY0_TILAU|nr:uncharacterized protein K437DRAFT_194683 [Tilletiaria anomala UBC 951]KDN39932.1 hypothetical protein K437DRAFT_194683 [Tilletiaria anomala UBC 951]